MFWKLIKITFMLTVLLVVLIVGIEFSTLHSEQVTVHYLLGVSQMPLSLLVVCSFASGVALTLLVGMFVVFPLRWQVGRLRQLISSKDQEISFLTKRIGRDLH